MAKRLAAFIFIMVMLLALPVPVSANAAEPPGMTIIVEGAPKDISLSLVFVEEPEHEVRVQSAQKSWEVYFRLFYYVEPGMLNNASIRVESSEKTFVCPLPEGISGRYNNLLTLNFDTETLSYGQRWWRQPMLTAIRVVLTLLVEGLIFFAFGFRRKRSWAVFFIANLLSQGWLNSIINSNAFTNGYWLLGLYLAEFVIFIAEAIAFPLATKEKKKWLSLLYALVANAASLLVGMLLIRYLPI